MPRLDQSQRQTRRHLRTQAGYIYQAAERGAAFWNYLGFPPIKQSSQLKHVEMDSVSESYSHYIRNRYLPFHDSGFNSTDTMGHRNDRWTPSRSSSPVSLPLDSYHSDHYGVFFMDEDMNHRSFGAVKEEAEEECWNSTYHSSVEKRFTSTSLHFPGVFVEGFRDGRVEFNIPGVMRDQFSPPDEISVHFKLPHDESGQMRNSDLDCLTKAGEVMNQWRKQYETPYQPLTTQQSVSLSYRSYFEGDDPHPFHYDNDR
ncbi:hypothetical protein ECG_00533 [Echinococcus granulosus]|nr:hypothetical protein ECG_00533 [Echinococcus granulosus]